MHKVMVSAAIAMTITAPAMAGNIPLAGNGAASHVSQAAPAGTGNVPLPRGMWQPYFPDVSRPLYVDRGILACDTAAHLQFALRSFEYDLMIDWSAPGCRQRKADQEVRILRHTLGSMKQAVMAEIEGPRHHLRWTLLQWLDDHADMTITAPAIAGNTSLVGNAACWGDDSRQDTSRRAPTESFLMPDIRGKIHG